MTAPALTPVAQEGPPGSGAIAGGSRATVAAGAAVLSAGGNAVDAALAAMAASATAEISLTSLGGGGFLLVRTPDGEATMLDFFVDTPGRGAGPSAADAGTFVPVHVHYPGITQVFHVGPGSVAVPGGVSGLLDAHRSFGRLPLPQVLAPAISVAERGTDWEEMQVHILQLIYEIFELQQAGRDLVNRPDGSRVLAGDALAMPHYARLLRLMADGAVTGLDSRAIAEPLTTLPGGSITAEDLARYRVYHRRPLTLHRHGSDILTNTPPSFGGPIIIDALGRTPRLDSSAQAWAVAAANLHESTERTRNAAVDAGRPLSQRGTTHVSVVDGDGMIVSLTTSNGSGSGVWIPELGLHLNNMLGEEDLNPGGFHAAGPGVRMGSMMSPTVVQREDGALLAMGTGGSERIRSALFAVLLRTVDLGLSAADAIAAPRMHPGPEAVQLEPGWPSDVVAALAADGPVNVWPSTEVYFGGVHAVMRRADGSVQAVGDPRRHGTTAVVDPQGRVLLP
jgi:gamma-glutamyltranspeptidase/glutathione hydrolase